jgi:hypothetical protein
MKRTEKMMGMHLLHLGIVFTQKADGALGGKGLHGV